MVYYVHAMQKAETNNAGKNTTSKKGKWYKESKYPPCMPSASKKPGYLPTCIYQKGNRVDHHAVVLPLRLLFSPRILIQDLLTTCKARQ